MDKFTTRLIEKLGCYVRKDELADQCEINSISYCDGKPVQTDTLLKCRMRFFHFEILPESIDRCFCGRLINICFVINHIPTGKQFVLGKDCLHIIFGDRIRNTCSRCSCVSSRENRVMSNDICKSCIALMENHQNERPRQESKPVSFEFNGSSHEKYLADRQTLCRGLAHSLIKFGKYKNYYTIAQIYERDPSYFRWLTTTVDSMRIFHGYFDQLEI